MNKFSVNYANPVLTKHCFNTLKELRLILNELKGIRIERMSDDMPKHMRTLCMGHNYLNEIK